MAKNKVVKIELGKCPFCSLVILKIDEKTNNPVREKKYREMWILLSDNSKMKVAVCDDCRETVTDAQIKALIIAHQDYWKGGLEWSFEQKRQELEAQRLSQIDHYSNLKSVRFAKREHDLD